MSSPSHSLKQALISTTLVQVLATAIALALTPIAPRAAHDFGIDPHYIGFQISLIYCAGAFASAASGTLIHRHGAVAMEVLSLALFGGGLLLLATARLPLGMLGSVLIGVGYGLQNPASSQLLNQACPPEKRSVVFSIKQAGVPLGALLASLALPWLDGLIGWRLALVIGAIGPVALILHILRAHRHEAHRRRPGGAFLPGLIEEQRLVSREPRLRVLALLGLLYSAVQLSLSAYIVLMLVDNRGWPLVSAAAMGGLLQGFGALGRVFWGWLADRTRAGLAILALIGLGSSAALVALPLLGALPAALQGVLLCALGFFLSGWNGVAMAEIARSAPLAQTGRVMGGALVYTFLGVMLGPASFAFLYEALGRYDSTFAAVALATTLGALAAAWRHLAERHA